jgi:hypothetical protein
VDGRDALPRIRCSKRCAKNGEELALRHELLSPGNLDGVTHCNHCLHRRSSDRSSTLAREISGLALRRATSVGEEVEKLLCTL